MSFIPSGAEAPKSEGKYLKPIEGSIKFRVVSPMIFGYIYWTNDKKPVRLKAMPKNKPENIQLNADDSYSINHFWAFSVIDRNDLGGVIKILEITQNGVKRAIEEYLQNPDWANPFDYDITITGKGSGLERRYTVQPSPHKPLTAEEKKLVAETKINLNALYEGKDPFNSDVIVEPEEDISADSIPF